VARQVQRAIAALPAPRRLAVRLHLRGFTSQEIATFLGWTEPKGAISPIAG
jgi:DNA-directed RNA polymerase specialized sigma24 family protein